MSSRRDPRRDGSTPPVSVEQTSAPDAPSAVRSNLTAPPRVPSDPEERAEALVKELMTLGPGDEDAYLRRLLGIGHAALRSLKRYFPGGIWFDYRRPHLRYPRGADVSAVARTLVAFNDAAVPVVVELLEVNHPDIRFDACLVATDLHHQDLVRPIGMRLFDSNPYVRGAAQHALDHMRDLDGFDEVLASARTASQKSPPDEWTTRAIETLLALRDAAAVPALIDLLEVDDIQISWTARDALVTLTCQDFSDDMGGWRSWATDNRALERRRWLIDSLGHAQRRLRALAIRELELLLDEPLGLDESSPDSAYLSAQARLRDLS